MSVVGTLHRKEEEETLGQDSVLGQAVLFTAHSLILMLTKCIVFVGGQMTDIRLNGNDDKIETIVVGSRRDPPAGNHGIS